jgi:CTP-dependent riboflavin kinase
LQPGSKPKNKNVKQELDGMLITGKIFSGYGEGAKFVRLPWVKKQITERLGIAPYPGTLNLRLTKDYKRVREILERIEAFEISPKKGYCQGRFFRARLMKKRECAVIVPLTKDYPNDVVEIIAPVNLRRELGFNDGDLVNVELMI